jgi:hypothetical protein
VNFYGFHAHRIDKIGLALQAVKDVRGIIWQGGKPKPVIP